MQPKINVQSRFSRVQLVVTPWIIARQAPPSVGFSRQEHWGGLPFSSPGDLYDPGIKPMSLPSTALAGGFFTTSTTWEAATPRLQKKKKTNLKKIPFYLGL